MSFYIGEKLIGPESPTYFVADIGANHDGDLERAKDLIHLCSEAGADAAKFQNFQAENIVSDYGFHAMAENASHQANWKKSVIEIYQDASVPFDWTPILKDECEKAGLHYLSSPYDFEAIDMLEDYVPAYKVGSGDIDWLESLERIASKGIPVIIASGAASIADVDLAMETLSKYTVDVCLMQCNTNYTGSTDNFDHVHLNVLKTYSSIYPETILGLSDHTPGHASVLGAVALGARMIEKHFTDHNDRVGPDHPFAMNPKAWRDMVDRTRELERALGSSRKFIAENEKQTKYVQRRCVRANRDLEPGQVIRREDLDVLRPFEMGAIRPSEILDLVGHKVAKRLAAGSKISWLDIVE